MVKPVLGTLGRIDPEIFMDLFQLTYIKPDMSNLPACNAVLFGGGTDVDPAYYRENRSRFTDVPDKKRDKFEWTVFRQAQAYEIPMLGICRGSQLLTVCSGGKLVQHVEHHAGPRHDIELMDGRIINVNSYHHQMMLPDPVNSASNHLDVNILGWATPKRSDVYFNGENTQIPDVEKEAEIVLYSAKYPQEYMVPNMLCIQGHPEWENPGSPFLDLTLELVQKHIIEQKGI